MKMNDRPGDERPRLHRVFFALWPDNRVNEQLNDAFVASDYYPSSRGRRYKKHNLHITLHFLGNVTEDQLNCAKQQAAAVRGLPFSLSIDHFGRFKRAGVLWLAPSTMPDALSQLQRQLGDVLAVCGYQAESREYRPHVTLMRKFHDKVEANTISPVDWPVKQFALVESVPVEGGVEYRPLVFYPLNDGL